MSGFSQNQMAHDVEKSTVVASINDNALVSSVGLVFGKILSDMI
jgi:hypothetical protein